MVKLLHIRQTWAAEKALRCWRRGLGAPGRQLRMQNLERGEELKGLAGEHVWEALLQVNRQRPREGDLDFTATEKLWGNYQVSSSPLGPFQQLQTTPLIYLYLERGDIGSFVMTINSLFCPVWWICIHKKQVEKASSNTENKAPLRQKWSLIPFFHTV